MASLNRLASNWSHVEREKLNTNWAIIENYLSNLQRQINLLTGDVNVQELIDKINDIFDQGNVIIGDLETALQEASTVIANAQNATTDANNAAQEALNAINDMQAFINQFGNAETYENGKLYKVNNIVEFDGSGFICIQDTQGNQPPTLPTKRNEWWQLIAQRGVDGNGSVSKVAGKSPELDGNVPLTAQDVGAVSSNEFNEHLEEKVTKGDFSINVKFPPAPLVAATGDGVSNDTDAFKGVITYLKSVGGGVLKIPKGKFKITSTLTIDASISIQGAGSDGTDMDGFTALHLSVSAIVWAGGSAPIFNITGLVGGVSWRDFVIDGANLASIGVNIDQLRNSVWENIVIIRCETGVKMLPVDGGIAASNTMFNTFSRLHIFRCSTCLYLDGTGISNVCHNVFINLSLEYTGNYGVHLGDSDNNCFVQLYIISRGKTGYGLRLLNAARNNYFYHYQGNLKAESGSNNTMFGYDRENGQARPEIDSGAKLFWTENGNNAQGWRMTSPLEALSVELLDDYEVVNGLAPSPNAFRIHRNNSQLFTFDFVDSSRKARLTYYDGISTDTVQFMTLKGNGIENFVLDGNNISSSTSMPTSGNFKQGDYVKNAKPTILGTTGSKYVIKGWIRITTGSTHNLNTDWIEDRCVTGS